MKFKYYLRGAGIGIIIAVLVMFIGGSSRTMSDGEIIRRAQELGMVKAEEGSGTVKDYNSKSSAAAQESSAVPSSQAPAEPSSASIASSALEQSSAAATSSAAEQSLAATASSAVSSSEAPSSETPSSAAQPSSEDVPSSSASYSGPDPVDNGTTVTITIPTGMLSDKVAEMIQRAGLISDAKDFNRYLISKGYDRQILKGDCVIRKGSSYEEIAKLLVSKNR
ncbi:MAG: hypothetical protein IK152_03105 [Lachnospiraceae bacterium]|nr:hypothetical protein [Lachnospiraceae bacterium]